MGFGQQFSPLRMKPLPETPIPQTQRGALIFAGSNSEARFCCHILKAVLAKSGGGCSWGRAIAHDVCALLWDFQTMKTKLILLKTTDPNITGWGIPALW